jgi:hypothetical protein
MRSKYWTIGKFADWLRGTPKLKCGTSEEWDVWYKDAAKSHPIRYWIVEEGLNYLQKIVYYIPDKLNDLRYYVNNRWVSRSHSLTAHPRDIRPGQWQDVGYRFLPCLFNELVDFVEIEQAWHTCIWDEEARKKYNPPWWRSGWLRLRTWRCPEAGLAHLNWASTLTDEEFLDDNKKNEAVLTNQANSALEIIELYTWWTTTYRNRPDPYELSGWNDYCEQSRKNNNGKLSWTSHNDTPELQELSKKAHAALMATEEAYEKEDTEMMIRLIKIRRDLWT